MKPTAIVYTSNTGYTAAYAALLGEKTGLPTYALEDWKEGTEKPVIYLGWLMAGSVVKFKKAIKSCRIVALCGVGLGDTGSQLAAVRKTNSIPEEVPLFTLQGGMNHEKLRGVYKSMIRVLTKVMTAKKNRTKDEDRMLDLLIKGGNYVCEENLSSVLAWYNEQ